MSKCLIQWRSLPTFASHWTNFTNLKKNSKTGSSNSALLSFSNSSPSSFLYRFFKLLVISRSIFVCILRMRNIYSGKHKSYELWISIKALRRKVYRPRWREREKHRPKKKNLNSLQICNNDRNLQFSNLLSQNVLPKLPNPELKVSWNIIINKIMLVPLTLFY